MTKTATKKSTPKTRKKNAAGKAHTAADARLIAAAQDMLAHHRGTLALETRRAPVPATINVAAIRKNLGLSQHDFANHFGFALSALREWEQGRRSPERATRILLTVIATNPQAVEHALHHFS